MSLVKITTPLKEGKFNVDGFYTCGNYIAVVGFAQTKHEFTIIMVMDQHNNTTIEEVVIRPQGLSLVDQIKQWQKVAREINTKYENQKNN
jgi:hypothetical protein